MIANLQTIEQILYLDLKPWLVKWNSETHFRQQLSELKTTGLLRRPLYEVRFQKPLTAGRKYYHRLIECQINRFLNDFHGEMKDDFCPDMIRYLVHLGLAHTIAPMLKDLDKLIVQMHFTPGQYALGQQHLHPDDPMREGSWVLHLMKHQLVRLYLEIQDSYPDFLHDDPFTLEEIYNRYFDEQGPQPQVVVPLPPLASATLSPVRQVTIDARSFVAVQTDLRETAKGVPAYRQLVREPASFSHFEQQLCEHGLIDSDYRFVDRYGNKNLMAAIYHQLISKGFFQRRLFPGNLKVSPRLIRKFLDHRYQCDIDKQFRLLLDDPPQCQKIIDRYYWISALGQR